MSAGPPRSRSRILNLSRCANSAATRPRFSHAPRRIVSISAGDFSGNAAMRLARPIRCSGNHGPAWRMNLAARFAMRVRSARRSPRSKTATDQAAIVLNDVWNGRLATSPKRLRAFIRIAREYSKRDNDFSEHLSVFEPSKRTLDVGEVHLGVDNRKHSRGHFIKALADVAD